MGQRAPLKQTSRYHKILCVPLLVLFQPLLLLSHLASAKPPLSVLLSPFNLIELVRKYPKVCYCATATVCLLTFRMTTTSLLNRHYYTFFSRNSFLLLFFVSNYMLGVFKVFLFSFVTSISNFSVPSYPVLTTLFACPRQFLCLLLWVDSLMNGLCAHACACFVCMCVCMLFMLCCMLAVSLFAQNLKPPLLYNLLL